MTGLSPLTAPAVDQLWSWLCAERRRGETFQSIAARLGVDADRIRGWTHRGITPQVDARVALELHAGIPVTAWSTPRELADQSGRLFGPWTALALVGEIRIGETQRRDPLWKSQCLCGREAELRLSYLYNVRSWGWTACGCARMRRRVAA